LQAHIINACLTGNRKAETLMFENAGYYGGAVDFKVPDEAVISRKDNKQGESVRLIDFKF
jgi:hypothetical protein